MPKRLGMIAVSALLLAACGGGSSSTDTTNVTKATVNPAYGEFCVTAAELDAASNDTHGNDPTAMSDPEKMKEAWSTIITSSEKLYEAAPDEVKGDVEKLLKGMKSMDKVYATYKYNLAEMKAVPSVAEELNKITNDAETAQASQHFMSWMSANCAM